MSAIPIVYTIEQLDAFQDLVAIYKPVYTLGAYGEASDATYGPTPAYDGVICYRETKKEIKAIGAQGQYLINDLFTTDVFHFALGIDISSNYAIQYISKDSPDYGMWFMVVGMPQPLRAFPSTPYGSNNLEVLCKRITLVNGVPQQWPPPS